MSWTRSGVRVYLFSLLIVSLHGVPLSSSTKTIVPTSSSPQTLKKPTPVTCIEDECHSRLLAQIDVHSYELEYIYKNTNDTTVQGQVIIDFTLKQPVSQLIYHGKRLLNLTVPTLYEDGVQRLVTMGQYAPNNYISLRLDSNETGFPANHYRLKQSFVVNLVDGNIGFYQGTFNDGNRTRGKILATKFQPTDARKAFPCFDEPQFKAMFKITIVHPTNTIALANFPTAKETVEDGLRRTTFAETFPMSTYLAAWAVLPDTYGQLVGHLNNTPITVWARRDPTDKGHTGLALEIARNSVLFFTEYFNTSEPVTPKIDLLAVPDFSSGAMENWGLVSFREDRIMFDDKIVSILQKQQLGETMAHEIAHFWFGNYVTCKWWDDLWLNEAMATWLSYKPFTAHYPDWNMELQALTEDVIPVMWDDAKPSSHAIVVRNVTSAADITSLFDSITYSKGASILRMLEKIVGADVFRDGLRDYLTSNAFGVGDPSVFYNNLFTNISGEEFMRNWLEEMNYPMLHVHLKVDENGTEIVFNQSRFIISDVLDASKLNDGYRWMINIQCILGGDATHSDVIDVDDKTVNFVLQSREESRILPEKSYTWIKCNRQFQGFYVTQYSSELSTISSWQRFSSLLEAQPNLFSDEDKVNLLQDAFLLAYKGLIDYIEPLRIFRSLVQIDTKQYVIWRTFQWHWDLLADVVEYLPETWTKFKTFAIDQVLQSGTSVDEILQINATDDHSTNILKGMQFSFLCRMSHPEAIERAHALFRSIPVEHFNGSHVDINIGPDFLSTTYICHLSHDDNETDWNMMYNYYKIATSPQEQTRALVAISSTRSKERLNQLLYEGLRGGPNTIKRQDFFAMIAYISRHPAGREVAWSYYRNNFQKLVNTFTLENRRLGIAINSIARSFEKHAYLDEMNEVFKLYPKAGTGVLARKQAVDQVNMNVAWITAREENLREALDIISRQ